MKKWMVADPEHLGGSLRVRDTHISVAVAEGILPAVEPWRPARRNKRGCGKGRWSFPRASEKFAAHSGRRDASPLRQARTPDATALLTRCARMSAP